MPIPGALFLLGRGVLAGLGVARAERQRGREEQQQLVHGSALSKVYSALLKPLLCNAASSR